MVSGCGPPEELDWVTQGEDDRIAGASGRGDDWSDQDASDQDDVEERRWRRRAARAEEAQLQRARELAIDHLPFTLREASRSVDATLALALDHAGFEGLSLSALHVMVLARHPKPVSAIAERMRCSQQAVSKLVTTLSLQALVAKAPSAHDGRVRLVEVTEDGEELLERLRDRLLLVLGFVADEVGEQRLAGLQEELARVALLDPHPDRWGRW